MTEMQQKKIVWEEPECGESPFISSPSAFLERESDRMEEREEGRGFYSRSCVHRVKSLKCSPDEPAVPRSWAWRVDRFLYPVSLDLGTSFHRMGFDF